MKQKPKGKSERETTRNSTSSHKDETDEPQSPRSAVAREAAPAATLGRELGTVSRLGGPRCTWKGDKGNSTRINDSESEKKMTESVSSAEWKFQI